MTDKEAFILQLREKYSTFLIKIAKTYEVPPDDIEDLIQDVLEIAIRKVDILMTYKDPKVWLAKTMRNCIRNYQRRHANSRNSSLEDYSDFPAPERADPLFFVLPAQLSDSEKQILTWRFEEDIGYKEMSKRLGITEVYCRVKVSRVLKKYRELKKNDKSNFS